MLLLAVAGLAAFYVLEVVERGWFRGAPLVAVGLGIVALCLWWDDLGR